MEPLLLVSEGESTRCVEGGGECDSSTCPLVEALVEPDGDDSEAAVGEEGRAGLVDSEVVDGTFDESDGRGREEERESAGDGEGGSAVLDLSLTVDSLSLERATREAI